MADDDDYAPVDPTDDEKGSYGDAFTQNAENGSVWITGYQSEDQLAESALDSWNWKQIEAAILGGAAVDDGPNGVNQDNNDTRMKRLADPQSLWNAAEILAGVHQTMTTVADSLLEQVNSLAGENGSWQGEGAESFRSAMEKVHRYIVTKSQLIIGTGNMPEQLWADGSYLDWAQQEIRKIDAWYAQEALEASGGDSMMSNNKVQISAHPEIVTMMTDDMRHVAHVLTDKYMASVDSVNTVTTPYTADLDMPGDDTGGSEVPPEDYYPETPPPEDYYQQEGPPPEDYSQQEGLPDTGAETPPPDAFSTETPPPGAPDDFGAGTPPPGDASGAGAPDAFGADTPPPGDELGAGAPDDFGAGTSPPGDESGARAPDAFGAGTPPPDDLAGTGSPDDFATGGPPPGTGDAGGQTPLPVTPFGGTAPPGGAGTGNRPAGSGAGAPDSFTGGTGPDGSEGLPGLDPLDTSGTDAPGSYTGDTPPSTEVPLPEDWATGGGPGTTGGGLDDRGGTGAPMMPPPMMGGGDPGAGGGDKSDAAGLLGGESEPWTGGIEPPPYEPSGGDAPVRDPAEWATSGGIGSGVSTSVPGAGAPMMPPPMMGGGDPGSGSGDKSDAAGLLGGESEPWVGVAVPAVSEPEGGNAVREEPAEWATSGAGEGGVPGAPVMPPPMMGGGDPGSGSGDKSDAAGLLGGESEPWVGVAVPAVSEPEGGNAVREEPAEWATSGGGAAPSAPVLPPPLASRPRKAIESTPDTPPVDEVAEPLVDDHVPVVRPSTENEDTSAWNVLASGGSLGFLANLITKPRKDSDAPDGPGRAPEQSQQAVYRRTRDGKVIMDAPPELRCTDWPPPEEASDDPDDDADPDADPDADADADAEEEPRTAVNLLKQSGDAWGDTSRTTSRGVLE